MIAVQTLRRIQRLHYSCMNAVVPYKASRWAFFLLVGVIFAVNTPTFGSDLTTYLIAFYLLYLIVNYFIPRGVQELDSSEEEEEGEELFALNASLGSSFGTMPSELERSIDKPLLR